tara:strand:+ start:193 stop:609 length:417 start_codon:yes stop_codon:yes gene_type:complete
MNKITYYNEEKYLLHSSSLLLVPSLFGFAKGNVRLSCLNIASCFISKMFWNNPVYDWRRYLDIYYQTFLCCGLFALGNYNFVSTPYMIAGNLFFSNGLYFFYRSSSEYKKKNRLWYIYHSIFHASMATSCIFVHLTLP